MDLVDSFVPSFKRKAPEAQSFVELKKVKEPFNVNDIDVEMEEKSQHAQGNKLEKTHDHGSDLDKTVRRKAPTTEGTKSLSGMKIVKNRKYDETSKIRIPTVNKMRRRLKEGQLPDSATMKPPVQTQPASTEKSQKTKYQNNLRLRIKNLYKNDTEEEDKIDKDEKVN